MDAREFFGCKALLIISSGVNEQDTRSIYRGKQQKPVKIHPSWHGKPQFVLLFLQLNQ